MCLCLRRTYKPGRRKHKRNERKLKNSDKLSAYILVRHVGIKSRAKRQSGRAIVPHLYASALAYVTLCLCLSHMYTSLCLCMCLCLCLRCSCKQGFSETSAVCVAWLLYKQDGYQNFTALLGRCTDCTTATATKTSLFCGILK